MITTLITIIIITTVSYLIGSINFSIIISKFIGTDIRGHGSGNAGATNMLRTYGKKIGVLTLICDALKGVIAVGLANFASRITDPILPQEISSYISILMKCICAIFVVLGHNYPIFFQFKGGKGIATSAATIFMLDYRIGLIVLLGALIVMIFTRYISLGSIIGALLFPISSCIFTFFIDKDYNYILLVTAILMCALAVYRHNSNILRLINGTESKIGKKSKED